MGLLVVGAVAIFVLTMFMATDAQRRAQTAAANAPVPFATARALINTHCIMCHSAAPSHVGITAPPAGLDFTKDNVVGVSQCRRASALQAVDSQTMPLGNETHMTDAERKIDWAPGCRPSQAVAMSDAV